ncbi:MAG: hypothetical protein ACI91B_004265 [Planctomycetota bacterium]|jgi:hypothetical protein
MATATNNKSTKKPVTKAVSKAAKPASKAKSAAKKTPSVAAATTKSAVNNRGNASASPASKAKLAVKEKSAVPERSSPAMAVVDTEVLEFIAAIDDFKRVNGRPFPSWSEVLLVVRQLGYKRK